MTMRESGDGDRVDADAFARPLPRLIEFVLDDRLDVFDVHAPRDAAAYDDEWLLVGEAEVFYNTDGGQVSVTVEYELKPQFHDDTYDMSRLQVVIWLPEGTVYG